MYYIGLRSARVHAIVRCRAWRVAPDGPIADATCAARSCGALRLHPLGEHAGDLGAAELRRRELARAEQLAHLGPGEGDVRRGIVRARLARGHPAARAAVERVLEAHGLDPQLP